MTRILLLTALLMTPLGAFAQDKGSNVETDVKKVLDKAIEAHGGKEALEKSPASSAKMRGEMTAFGINIPFEGEMLAQRPDKARVTLNVDVQGTKIDIVQIINGEKVKVTGGSENPSDAEKEEMRQIPLLSEISQLTPLLDSDRFTVKMEKDEKVGDSDASVLLVTGKKLKDVRLFFDKKTGLLTKTSRKALAAGAPGAEPMTVTEESVFSEFKSFEGVKTPTKTVVTHDGKPFMSMTVSDVKYMDKADAKSFAVDD